VEAGGAFAGWRTGCLRERRTAFACRCGREVCTAGRGAIDAGGVYVRGAGVYVRLGAGGFGFTLRTGGL
jgi:hypothetical protein